MKKENKDILYIVIPCYNEEKVLIETTKILKKKINKLIKDHVIDNDSHILYVDDGSLDSTWSIVEKTNKEDKLFQGISLSRNTGHQNALVAGLLSAKVKADIVITMDADLQDDINAIDAMLEKYKQGNDVVYGIRSKREKDSWFKKSTARLFYKIMKFMGIDIICDHADYRLTSKKVLDEFENYKEVNLFLRGIFPLIGFKHDFVYYERNERIAGKSKYSLSKMINFALDGITSFTVRPLRFICILGVVILLISLVIMIYSLIQKVTGNTVAGWTFLSISIWFLGGLQMISIGIIGEYVGKTYSETKARPRFIISKKTD